MTDVREQVASVFDWAADYLDAHGWIQGHAFGGSPNGLRAACAVGAFVMANSCHTVSVVDHARHLLQAEVGHIGQWNDQPGREIWEITTLLRDMGKRVRHGDLSVVTS